MKHATLIWAINFGCAVTLLALTGCATNAASRCGRPARATDVQFSQSFDDSAVGAVPPGWRIDETNPTTALAGWGVIEDATAPSRDNVLALTKSENYNGTYNLAIAEKAPFGEFGDLDLSVKVKAVAGKEDQGGGPIWRCRDRDNYYICRFNPLEGNYRVYVVKNGRRRQLESIDVDVRADRWYTIRVTMAADKIDCYLDGEKMLSATDATFTKPGKVGLWTKADAVTSFDDLTIALQCRAP